VQSDIRTIAEKNFIFMAPLIFSSTAGYPTSRGPSRASIAKIGIFRKFKSSRHHRSPRTRSGREINSLQDIVTAAGNNSRLYALLSLGLECRMLPCNHNLFGAQRDHRLDGNGAVGDPLGKHSRRICSSVAGFQRSRYFGSRMFPSQGTGNAPWSKARSWNSASVKSLPLAAS